MKRYQHILLAVDLHPENDASTQERAQEIRHETGAQLSIVHAVEHINSYGASFAYPAVADIQNNLFDEARKQIEERAMALDINQNDIHIEVGSPKPVIMETALNIKADLIVVGSHSRHGFHLMLASTANSLLHDAPCDVLAVRLQD